MKAMNGMSKSAVIQDFIGPKRQQDVIQLSVGQLQQLLDEMNRSLYESIKGLHQRNFIQVFYKEEYYLLKEEDIIRLEAEESYTRFYTEDQEFLSCRRLGYYEKKCSEGLFFRCHKSHIINLSKVYKMGKGKNRYVVLQNGTIVPVASSKNGRLDQVLGI